MPEHEQKPDHLTDEEWEALHDEEGGLSPNDDAPVVDDDDLDDEAARADAEKAAADAAAAAEAERVAAEAAAADAAAAEAEAARLAEEQRLAQQQSQQQDDSAAKLAEIASQKNALDEQFDGGDMTSKEYREKLADLEKQEREIEVAKAAAQAKAQAEYEAERRAFLTEARNFMKGTPYEASPTAQQALDAALKRIGADPSLNGKTHREYLELAHAEVLKDPVLAIAFKKQDDKPAPTAPGKKPVPPTLAKMPAAQGTEAGENRFAALDRLADVNPLAYEDALAKLSPADRDAYLAQG